MPSDMLAGLKSHPVPFGMTESCFQPAIVKKSLLKARRQDFNIFCQCCWKSTL